MRYLYYKGIRLPEIPSDYTYAFVYLKPTEPVYRVCVSASKYFWRTSDNTLQPGSNTVKNYWLTTQQLQSGMDWQVRDSTAYYFSGICHWSNYDIPKDSKSGTEIYFHSGQASLKNVYLANQWQGSIGNVSTPLTLTMDGCTPGNMLVLAYACRGETNAPILSDGWVKLGGGNNEENTGDKHQRLYFCFKIAQSTSETVTITQKPSSRLYAVCSEYFGVSAVKMRNDLAAIGETDYTVVGKKTGETDMMLYAVTSVYYGTGRIQTVSPADISKIDGDSSEERLACWFDGGLGAKSHTFITYNGSGKYGAIVECVQLLTYDRKYLVRSNGTLYTVADGALSEIGAVEPTAEVFRINGVDDLPDGALLLPLTNPEVLYWHDSQDELPELSMTVKGTPPLPQMFTSKPISMAHESIAGIDYAEIDASEDVRFAITFDGGTTWKAHNGEYWYDTSDTAPGMLASTFTAITPTQWAEVAPLGGTYRLRFWIPSVTAYVKKAVIHYINP